MNYKTDFTDVFLLDRIKENEPDLIANFDKSISEIEMCMSELQKGIKICKNKHLNDILIVWNFATFINVASIELKAYFKALVNSTNNWEFRIHLKSAYLLIHSFYETYDKIQKDYRRLEYHKEISLDYDKLLADLTREVHDFRNNYLAHLKSIRNTVLAHINTKMETYIETMEDLKLSDTIKVVLDFHNILLKFGKLLSMELKYKLYKKPSSNWLKSPA